MRILVSLNLLFIVVAIGVLLLIRGHQVLVHYELDGLLHSSPVRSGDEAILLPLHNCHDGASYRLQVRFGTPSAPATQEVDSGVRIHGEDLGGREFGIFVGAAQSETGARGMVIPIEIRDNDVRYVAIGFDAELRERVSLIGVGASTSDIKASSADASITRNATNNLLLLLSALLAGQIASLIALIRRTRRRVEVTIGKPGLVEEDRTKAQAT